MINFSVPESVLRHQQITAGDISYVYYTERSTNEKHRVAFNNYAISFVLNGQKKIYRSVENAIVKPGQAILIPAGNSIIAEHGSNDKDYVSLVIFFPAKVAVNFLIKHISDSKNKNLAEPKPEYIFFTRTAYLYEYVRSLEEMIRQQQAFSYAVALHKLEELLLIVYELCPQHMIAMFMTNKDEQQLSLKKIVENNLFNNLTLTELSFLANRSLSSFKRDFEKTYGISPQKYIRNKKLEAASYDLTKGRQASELFVTYGYENLSNFNNAFKKKFGITPAAFAKAQY